MEEVDIKEIFEYFKKKIGIFIIIIVSICLIGCLYSIFIQKPMYKSYATIVLSSNESTITAITQNDVLLNKNLVDTYAEIVKSRRVLEQVIGELNLDMSYDELYDKVSVTAVNDTEIIKITVSDENAIMAKNIANITANYFSKEVVELYNMNNVNVLDSASESKVPYNINIKKQAIVYFTIGIVIGAAIIFIMYYFDRTVKSVEQLEEKIKLPVLGGVEIYNKGSKEDLILCNKPKSIISENIRTIRTNLQFISSDEDAKRLLVTSAISGEGKSFISSNLAVAFAQAGKKVLLIDSDLRLGRLHKIFKVSNDLGLSNLLIQQNKDEYSGYIKRTDIDNLYVIPRGVVPPNPSELLNSERAKNIFDILSDNFDHIIFDGVPIMGLSDSLVIAGYVDKVIIACAAEYTKTDEIEKAKKALEQIDAKIAGTVLNKVNPNNTKTRNNYKSGYYE